MRGRHFDASSDPGDHREQSNGSEASSKTRPFLGIQFSCCNMYARIYKSPHELAYRGNCPRCGRTVNVPIGPGGSAKRFFTAGG